MSKIVENENYIIASNEPLYGIKIGQRSEITLPFIFDKLEDVKKFEQQTKGMYQHLSRDSEEGTFVSWNSDNTLAVGIKEKGRGLYGSNGLEVKFRPNITIKDLNGLGFANDEVKNILDSLLRHTILGEKLKQYWVDSDKLPLEDAQKRLEEITPLANKK